MSDMTTWHREFESARTEAGDESPVVAVAPDEATLGVEFDAVSGVDEGKPVLVWAEKRVYFPVQYDGSEYLGSAPRNPQSEGQRHVGGG